jgi:glycosyltransferase involved in cell wall biosynthesis
MKRVLVPLPPTTWGGLHAFSQNIAPALRDLGWEQVLVVPNEAGEVIERLTGSGMRVVPAALGRLRKSPLASARTIAGIPQEISMLAGLCTDHDIAVVQAVGAHHYHGLLTARRTGLPLVWQLHSNILPAPLRAIAGRIIRGSAKVIMTNGRRVGRSFFGPGFETMGARVFYAPLDASRFFPSAEIRQAVRAELGLPPDALVVGTIGNRVEQKDHALLLQIADLTRHLYPRLRYLILGADNEPYRARYQREVVDPAATLNRTCPGYITIAAPGTRVSELINALDIFALTSKAEGVPIALFEAGSMALPVLSTDVGSIAEVIEDDVTGHLFQRDDKTATRFAARIGQLADDPEACSALGSALRQRVLDDFSAQSVARIHAEAYHAAIAP